MIAAKPTILIAVEVIRPTPKSSSLLETGKSIRESNKKRHWNQHGFGIVQADYQKNDTGKYVEYMSEGDIHEF